MVNDRQRSSFESPGLRFALPFGSLPKHFSNSAKCSEVSGRSFLVMRGTFVRASYTHTVSVGYPLQEEDHVRLRSRTVRTERSVRQPQDGMQIEMLGQNSEDIPGLVRKQAIVRHNNRRASARLQDGHHVLKEVQL